MGGVHFNINCRKFDYRIFCCRQMMCSGMFTIIFFIWYLWFLKYYWPEKCGTDSGAGSCRSSQTLSLSLRSIPSQSLRDWIHNLKRSWFNFFIFLSLPIKTGENLHIPYIKYIMEYVKNPPTIFIYKNWCEASYFKNIQFNQNLK